MSAPQVVRALRVGSVPYLVGRPLDLGLELEPGIAYEQRVPARLVEGLRSGELDVALVSSIELFQKPGYAYLNRMAVSGAGFVSSVQVFLRKPVDAVRRIALDPASRTAATLVRVMLADKKIEYVEVAAGDDPRLADADAWLRIGDAALREFLAPGAPPVFNPSQAWSDRTGFPFVFAAWIARDDPETRARLEPFLPAFSRARVRGRAAVESIARRASEQWSIPFAACNDYLAHECVYDPGERMEPALLAFRDAAARLDLCRADITPRKIPVLRVT